MKRKEKNVTRFKRKNNLKFDKGKNILILFLCVTLFVAASSVTFSLFKKDKTTSPPVAGPKYQEIIGALTYEEIRNDVESCKIDLSEESLFNVKYINGDGEKYGLILVPFDNLSIPSDGTKIVIDCTYTLNYPVLETIGLTIADWPYGIVREALSSTGTHTMTIIYDGLDVNYEDPEEEYLDYTFTVLFDGVVQDVYNGSLAGGKQSINGFDGFGLNVELENSNIPDEAIIFTLDYLKVTVY